MTAPVKSTTRRVAIVTSIAVLMTLLIFLVAPQVERPLSGLFYRPVEGFWLRNIWPLLGVYYGTRVMMTIVAIVLISALAWSWRSKRPQARQWRASAMFAALSLILGPWLIAHAIKDHDGRARPYMTEDFGGAQPYTPPSQWAANCDHNCSFPSAHAIAGFWFITGAWVWPGRRRRWWTLGLGMGLAIGLVRIVQGGHYLSDVLAALGLMMLTNATLMAGLFVHDDTGRLRLRAQSPKSSTSRTR